MTTWMPLDVLEFVFSPDRDFQKSLPTMLARIYTPKFLSFCLCLLVLCATYVSAHMIEVSAATKECFFEDLRRHDKAPVFHRLRSNGSLITLNSQMTVTYQVGGGGHLDIDFWVCSRCSCSTTARLLTCLPAHRPDGESAGETYTRIYWDSLNYSRDERTTRILLFKPNERYRR